MKKLQDNRGELLVEVLASILIASLSVALLFGCVTVSAKLDGSAQSVDDAHYAALSAVEEQAGTGTPHGTVSIKNDDPGITETGSIGIYIYGDVGVYSYREQ